MAERKSAYKFQGVHLQPGSLPHSLARVNSASELCPADLYRHVCWWFVAYCFCSVNLAGTSMYDNIVLLVKRCPTYFGDFHNALPHS